MIEITRPIPVRCDCCGNELVAKVINGKLAIKTRKRGRMHDAYLSKEQVLSLFEQEKAKKLDTKKE